TAPSALPSPPLPPSLHPTPVDRRDDILESEQPPRKRICLSTLGSRYEVGESSTRGRGVDYGFIDAVEAEMRHRGIREAGFGIRDTWIDPAEAVPEMAPTTLEKLSSAAHVVLTTQRVCRPSLVSCLSLLGESLLSVTVTYGQSLRVLPSLSVVSESGSHVTDAVFGSVYSATVTVSGVSEAGTPVHILAYEGSEAHGVLSGLTLPNEPKPLGQHRPPPP
nr:hypothetical protein [Tanacetum cinerariifolium]